MVLRTKFFFIFVFFLVLFSFLHLPQTLNAKKEEPTKTKGKVISKTPLSSPSPSAKATSTPTTTTPKLPEVKGKKKDELKIFADNGLYNDKTKIWELWGNLRFVQGDTTVSGTKGTYNENTKTAILEGPVKITQPKTVLTGSKIIAYTDQKKAVVSGLVRLVKEGEPTKGKKKDEKMSDQLKGTKTTITCQELIYYWEKKDAIAIGKVTITQKDQKAIGDKAYYYDALQRIILTGSVRMERSNGDWLTCDKVTVHIKREVFEAQGNIKGKFLIEETKKKIDSNEETDIISNLKGNRIRPKMPIPGKRNEYLYPQVKKSTKKNFKANQINKNTIVPKSKDIDKIEKK